MNRHPRQFGIRTLLLVTLLVAVLLSAWIARPSAELTLTIRSGLAKIDGRDVPVSSLQTELAEERSWRRLWFRDCIVHLNVTDEIDIQTVLDSAAAAGVSVHTVRVDSEFYSVSE